MGWVSQPFVPFQQRVRGFPIPRNKLKRYYGREHLHFLTFIVIEKRNRFRARQRRKARKIRNLSADGKDAPPAREKPDKLLQ